MAKKIIILFAVIAIALTAVFLYADRIVVAALAKAYDLNIEYKECSKALPLKLTFKGLSVTSRRTGLGIAATSTSIKPIFLNKCLMIDFDLRDGGFIRKGGSEELRYDTITALITSPFSSKWRYSSIRGLAEFTKTSVTVKSLEAVSDDIRLSLKGQLTYRGIIDSDVVIYFAPPVTEKMPPEFAQMILSNEKDGWKSISVKLSGDPEKPSVQVSSKSFRLKVTSVSGDSVK